MFGTFGGPINRFPLSFLKHNKSVDYTVYWLDVYCLVLTILKLKALTCNLTSG